MTAVFKVFTLNDDSQTLIWGRRAKTCRLEWAKKKLCGANRALVANAHTNLTLRDDNIRVVEVFNNGTLHC